MKKIKKEALERIKAEIAEQIDNFDCLRFDGEQYAMTVHPKEDSDRWTGFAIVLQPEDFELDDLDQPKLFQELAPIPPPKPSKARRDRFVFPVFARKMEKLYPFEKGVFDIDISGFNVSTARHAIARCFRGAPDVKNPTLARPMWPAFDCQIEQIDDATLRVHIFKRN